MPNPMRMMTTVALPPWREPEIMDDLVEMCHRSKTTDVAVMMMGIPEDDENHEGVQQAIEQFRRIKNLLEPHGVRSGILIQSLIGHGERGLPIPPQPFQRIVGWDGTECRSCFCPLDEGFLEHTRQVIRMMAKAAPAFLLVDDDVRLDNHHPARWACACPLHVDDFNRATGRSLSRQQIFAAMCGDDELAGIIRDQWFESGEQSFLTLAIEIRKAIDDVDPSIRCGKCVSGGRHELRAEPFVRALAGKTRPFMRLAHATYGEQTYKQFAWLMANHQMQRGLMGNDIEYMCEADTFPQTIYSTSLTALRGYICGTLLASKVDIPYTWIPHPLEWVRSDWEQYADELGRSEPFFRALWDLSRKTTWVGPSVNCLRVYHCIPDPAQMPQQEVRYDLDWAAMICGRFGIPFTVNNPDATTVMLNGTSAQSLTTDEMRRYLSGGLLLDGPAALAFARRGLAEDLGVDVSMPQSTMEISMEISDDDPINDNIAGLHLLTVFTSPASVMSLKPLVDGARPISWFVRNRWFMDEDIRRVSPALTVYENKLGGRVAVYAHDLAKTAFLSFQNPTRRQQIIGLMKWLEGKPFPATADTSRDLYMLFGHYNDANEDVAALFNLNSDPVEKEVKLRMADRAPESVLRLDRDGRWRPLPFESLPGGIRLQTRLETMMPLVVRMRLRRD